MAHTKGRSPSVYAGCALYRSRLRPFSVDRGKQTTCRGLRSPTALHDDADISPLSTNIDALLKASHPHSAEPPPAPPVPDTSPRSTSNGSVDPPPVADTAPRSTSNGSAEPSGSQHADVDEDSNSRAAEIAADDVIVLLLAAAVGLSTGLAVVLFNTFVHTIQDEVVWRSVPRLAAFGTEGLQRDLNHAEGVWWRCLILPPVCGGACVALLRSLVGGFGGDPKSVAVQPRSPEQKPASTAIFRSIGLSSPASKRSYFGHVAELRIPSSSYVGSTPQKAGAVSTAAVPTVKAAGKAPSVSYTALGGAREFLQGLVKDVQQNGLQATSRPYVKLVAAAITLGSGASLGPEGPSVEVGKANAARITCAARERRGRVLTDLVAAGAGAGVAAGFGAPMSGVLFAVETVLLSTSKTGAAMPPAKHEDESGVLIASVLVACVCAAIVSQAGLGLEPAFQVPPTAPLSVPELPLCVIEGLLCGSAAAGLGLATANAEVSFERLRKAGVSSHAMPAIGGLACGSLALLFPEISYQGFDNFNALFQFDGRQSVEHTAAGLAALVVVKIAGTAVCRGSGLAGGVYAPALFIGAALGTAFWHVADGTMIAVASAAPHLHLASAQFELASANTYALVGAAAMLAAFCRVPLTAVLLLFELTQDYTLVLPTLMAVGFAQWGATTAPRFMR